MKRTRTKTLVTSVRCDCRSVAELARFWEGKGKHVESLSSLLRLSLEAFAELIVEKYPGLAVPTHDQAVKELRRKNIVDALAPDRRNVSNLVHELSLEDSEAAHTTPAAVNAFDPEQLAALVKQRLNEKENDEHSLADLISHKPTITDDSD